MRDSLVATTSEVQALQDQLNDMADIEYLEKSAGLDKIQKALSRVDLASRPFTKQKDIASTLSELESRILRESGVVRSLEGIVGVSSRLYQAIPLADKVSRIATDLDSLDAIDTTLLPTVSDGDLKTLPQAISRLSQASPMVSRLAVIALASGPILSDLTKLTSLDVQLEKVHKILAREQILAEIDAVEDRIRDTIPEISQVLSDLSKIDICPVCGQHTNLSKAVQDGHFHG
jgi:ACT domain-containing protein